MTFHVKSRGAINMVRNELGQLSGTHRFNGRTFSVIASIDYAEGVEVEHLSISLKNRLPTWDELKYFKSQFWDENDEVYHILPPADQYVNLHRFCMHLWRRHDGLGLLDISTFKRSVQ